METWRPQSTLLPPPPPGGPAAGSLPPVLVPGLDLCVREVEGGRQLHAVLDAQVLLPLEAALQLRQLVVGEGRAGLPGLLHPHLRAVSAAGDLPVPLLFHWRSREDDTRHKGTGVRRIKAPGSVEKNLVCGRVTSTHHRRYKSVQLQHHNLWMLQTTIKITCIQNGLKPVVAQ